MADQVPASDAMTSFTQLSQVHVPLRQAEDAFATEDANGRTPIVVLTTRSVRIQNAFLLLAAVVIAGGILGDPVLKLGPLLPIAILAAVIVMAVGFVLSLRVRIPEGTNAVLTRGGKYNRTVGPGLHMTSPYDMVSQLVTQREIPFDVPVVDAPSADSVPATVDVLATFTITEPHKFVYSISASDFDQVFQAACQYAMRAMIRQIKSDEINDLVRYDTGDMKAKLSADVAPYGVAIQKMTITYARPPADFVASQQARQLAVFHREQQVEEQMLAQRRQAAQEALERQQAIAQVQRQHEELQAQLQQAEMRKQVTELEMQAQELRLSRLEEMLDKFPNAAKWEWESAQLEVARALAGNTRAVLQVGRASDIVGALLVRQMMDESAAATSEEKPNGQLAEATGR